ncbi:hypothetical protein EYF80_050682 [Liparis tanakae]|uniref:Secreted protein n=1 Tax=Liparis tanakae TaxID=230148 RepID=A0A4Z2FEE6_9TELE|nr:hypothetical protein EYF80_050682 [Liparis tanakae]
MQQRSSLVTRMFLLFRSRWAMAGFPSVPKISVCRCTRPQATDAAMARPSVVSTATRCRQPCSNTTTPLLLTLTEEKQRVPWHLVAWRD